MGDLGGVEELSASVVPDYVRDDGVSDAGDKVADVFFSGKRRHGVEVGAVGCLGGIVPVFAFCAFCFIDAYPGAHAAGDAWGLQRRRRVASSRLGRGWFEWILSWWFPDLIVL